MQPYISLTDSGWVAGTIIRSGVNTIGTTTGDYQLFNVPTGKGFAFAQNNATNSLVIDSSNRVGIGTTSPGSALEINAAAATSPFIAKINTAEAARIDSSGRLLVGTSSDSGGALLQVNGDRMRIGTAKTPASAGATGTTGEIAWDANYIYVCTATNTWKRTAIATW